MDTLYGNEKRIKKMYADRNEEIMEFSLRNKKDLFIFDLSKGDGWEELCGFLGKEIPAVPFPHFNKGQGTKNGCGWRGSWT